MAETILIVDDDPKIRDITRIALEAAGMRSVEAANGNIALTHLGRERISLVVLDIGMPGMDGFECCKAIRAASDVPVLFLTARDDEIDRVLGFQLGADDFVAKPFSPRELILRIKAILSRGRRAQRLLEQGALSLDPSAHLCRIGPRDMELTATEFQLLTHLLSHAAQVRTREQLIGAIHGQNTDLSGAPSTATSAISAARRRSWVATISS